MRANDPVSRYMSQPVLTIDPRETIDDALRIFTTHSIHHLPVVVGRRVVGVLSSFDIARFKLSSHAARSTVDMIMRTPAISVPERETLQRAAELMAVNGIHSLPVVNFDAELVGIVTTTDLMRCCLDPQPEVATADNDRLRQYPLAEERVAPAIAAARVAVNTRHDPKDIAATLLSMRQQVQSLQDVVFAAKRYLNAGQDDQLHAALAKAIDRAERFDEATRQPRVLGLS